MDHFVVSFWRIFNTKVSFKLLILLIFVVSCKEDKISQNGPLIEYRFSDFKKKDSVNLKLPNTVKLSPVYWNIVQEDTNLIFINVGYNPFHLSKIRMTDSSIEKEYFFESGGPNGIEGCSGIYYHNKDSIFLIQSFAHKLYFINDKTNIVNKYDISDYFLSESYMDNRVFLNKNFIYLPGMHTSGHSRKNYVTEAKIIDKINLLNKNEKLIIGYPDEFYGKIWKYELLNTFTTLVNEHIFVSFGKSHFIYKYDLNGNLIQRYTAKSKYVADAEPLGNRNNNSDKAFNELYKNGYYTKICYDQYRNLFYRFALYLPKGLMPINGVYQFDDLSVSVLVFDNNLNFVKEFTFDNNVNGWYSYITEKGLALSLKRFRADDCTGDEECLKFYIYDILKNED